MEISDQSLNGNTVDKLHISKDIFSYEKYLPLRPLYNAEDKCNQRVEIIEPLDIRPPSQLIFKNCNIIEGDFALNPLEIELMCDTNINKKESMGFIIKNHFRKINNVCLFTIKTFTRNLNTCYGFCAHYGCNTFIVKINQKACTGIYFF